MSSWKESMINRLSNLINRNRSAAKISQVLCSNLDTNTLQLVDTRGHGVEDVAAASVSGNLYPFCPSC